jgi:hypothetical protein
MSKLWNKIKSQVGADDERSLETQLNDTGKSIQKRFQILLSSLKRKESLKEKITFLSSAHETAIYLCVSMLRGSEHKSSKKTLTWEDAAIVLQTLYHVTRYGYKSRIEDLKSITMQALKDNNRWEIKELGFSLLLNLLNICPEDELLLKLLDAAVDLNLFKFDRPDYANLVFPERSLLSNPSLYEWSNLYTQNDIVRKQYSNSPPSLPILKRLQVQIPVGQKECLRVVYKLMEYTLEPDYDTDYCSSERKPHFERWLAILQNSFLFLLYPKISKPSSRYSAEYGFQDHCDPSLHYLVIHWLIGTIKDVELSGSLFYRDEDYNFWMNVLGLSFSLIDYNKPITYKSAKKSLELYVQWVNGEHLIRNRDFTSHIRTLFKHTVELFDFSKEQSTQKLNLCKTMIHLLESFRESNTKLYDVLIEATITIARELQRSLKVIKTERHDIFEPYACYMLNTLFNLFDKTELPWDEFKQILQQWAYSSELTNVHWMQIMEDLTEMFKKNGFKKDRLEKAWFNMLHILGDPLKLRDRILFIWAKGLQSLIFIVVEPHHTAPSPNLTLNYFASTLFQLTKHAREIETRVVGLDCLTDIFIATRGNEIVHDFYLEHLARAMNVALEQNVMLMDTVLNKLPDLIPYYPILHILLPKALKVAKSRPHQGIFLAFTVLALPNYYKNLPIYSNNHSNEVYQDLKPKILSIFQSCLQDGPIASGALWGISVMIVEKLSYGEDDIADLVKEILAPLDKIEQVSDELAIFTFQCLNFLACFLGNYTETVVESFNRCLTRIEIEREKALIELLHTILNWLIVNNQRPCPYDKLTLLFNFLNALKEEAQDKSEDILNNIEILSSMLTFYYLNFPLKNEPTSTACFINPDAEVYGKSRVCHYRLDHNIITVIMDDYYSRFLIRSPLGKFYLQCEGFNIFESKTLNGGFRSFSEQISNTYIQLNSSGTVKQLKENKIITQLKNYIEQEYEDSPTNEPPSDFPYELVHNIEEFDQLDKIFVGNVQGNKYFRPILNQSRTILSQLGALDNLKLLEPSERLDRSLKILDGTICRERLKIGLVYVAPGQSNQREILANESSSLLFKKFVSELGDVVEVSKYEGYIGGLEPGGSSGKYTLTYCDWEHEVTFHVVPFMPTDHSDDQQVLKKRHVGNDIVQIIWSENCRDYRQKTITSQFNFVHIIIYPLPSNLFRVQILKKIPGNLGPLQDGMMVPWTILAPLVRATAINANHLYRKTSELKYEKPSITRKNLLIDTIQKNLSKATDSDTLSALF